MRPVSILFLQFVLLFPMVTSGQIVTDGQGQSIQTDNNFTFFTGNRNTGQLALVGNDTFFNLGPYDGTPTTQYEAREFPSELIFVINNKAADPISGSSYVGVEIIRLYTFGAVLDRVNMYRNGDWVDSMAQRLPEKRLLGPSLDEFVQDHSSDQPGRPYLIDWHAHASELAPSSWERRDAISNGLGLSTNRNAYVPENQYQTAQGTYRLIRFTESVAPSARRPVRFTLNRHSSRYLLINVFTPADGRDAYQNQYFLKIVNR